ncbi:hypothetical protein MYSTI_01162 [Myxococcus stipitatus DSM 14675]|uniref:Ubiquinone biosynthesis protein n=1 Tax=Myxococcus stipitatus (strain DSM 14675 / JCM 12634 / Mx s8) TaxID=1278073 RepID=L7U3U1_MYXSD|nr:Coq4 family protein [Myxococcus stipitatus]AGC42510.1 hypothetical protein MYSTI_01162 [Myxococcus stipitatus DSM 14675]
MRTPFSYVREAWKVARALRDPYRLQDILDVARLLAPPSTMRKLVDRLMQSPTTAQAFVERPRVGKLALDTLQSLPEGTLGRAFADHLKDNGLDPSKLPNLQAHTHEDYVRAHLLESHDIWHVLTGFRSDVAGELGIQAFSLAQVGSPFALGILAGGLTNTLLYAFAERDVRMQAITRGWVLGHMALPVFGAPWRDMWEHPLEEVRQRFGLDLDAVDAVLPALAPPVRTHAARRVAA